MPMHRFNFIVIDLVWGGVSLDIKQTCGCCCNKLTNHNLFTLRSHTIPTNVIFLLTNNILPKKVFFKQINTIFI